jgi:glucosamine--fructose-6-phosphate aminotransferase (isomerizing)
MGVVAEIASQIRKREPAYIFLAARGTSDNAGRYAQYLWGAHNRMPIALATPSLFTLYGRPPHLKGALVVGVSQSGQSPDIVGVLEEARRQGCLTLAITNTPDSPLAHTSDFVIDIQAGKESAVAATKTYTASLMAIAMLSQAVDGDEEKRRVLEAVPGWMENMLQLDDRLQQIAQRYRFMEQCVVLGRGYNYSTAFEWSLKMKELTYVSAEPYSSADFLHGPIAVVEQGYPVMAVAPGGRVYRDMYTLLARLKEERRAELLVISDQAEAVSLAQSPVQLPADIPEWASPLVAIVPAQLFSCHLTIAKGFDTDAPRGLRKVTETQ